MFRIAQMQEIGLIRFADFERFRGDVLDGVIDSETAANPPRGREAFRSQRLRSHRPGVVPDILRKARVKWA